MWSTLEFKIDYELSPKILTFTGGYYSQWAAGIFNLHGVKFNCAEQAMMFCKASLFADTDAGNLIMGELNPADQKKYGRHVKPYNDKMWMSVALGCVTMINYAKFTQYPTALASLLATGDGHIVEAAPWDKIWGIGMYRGHPDIDDPTKWKGTNWLGIAIMNARELIRNPTEHNMNVLNDLSRLSYTVMEHGLVCFDNTQLELDE